ncbi:hypothetical protein ERJ75_001013000 [Trypanosoma vivax]|uniref:Uncharacterized protein n=1 Tax=Trypanosoma vivax (strain Y486) TaxID=1055687 RepID=G0U259_TRYVY|nr:hypothetical protein TRVL_03995 [Trypanosoma vivax]KAH8611796.1 hypothetical protein ERJ75_001013000 [Trypanosoma vivax]CCC50362.1 conserved hypothetical protein [Trypanosoma vivax Y486]
MLSGKGRRPSSGASTDLPAKDYAKILEDAMDGSEPIDSATLARFINQYNPIYDCPYERRHLNIDRKLNEELCDLLVDDRRANIRHHLQTDKVQKSYMLMVIANKHTIRS